MATGKRGALVRRRRRIDQAGGLEGLPLYMIILVTIAAVILVAFVSLVPRPLVPSHMVVTPSAMCYDKPVVAAITVYSSGERPLNDAFVEMEGPGIFYSDKTHDGGRVFAHVTAHTPNPNPGPGTISIIARFGGATVVNSIPVNVCAPSNVGSREEALAVVFESVVHPDEHPNVEIFATEAPLQAGQRVETAWDDATQGPRVLADVDREAFLFFVDVEPGLKFEHAVRIALVYADGDVASFEAGWPPVIDGEERWMTEESRQAPGELVFSQEDAPQPVAPAGRGQSMALRAPTVPSYCQTQDIAKWVLAISASNDAAVNPQEAASLAETLRTSYGYSSLALNPSTMPLGWQTVQSAFASFRQAMLATPDRGYCDEFLVVWDGHGSPDGMIRLDYENATHRFHASLRGFDIAGEVDKTTDGIRGIQVRILIDTCFSGIQHEIYWSIMPPDPSAGPSTVQRDLYVMTAVNPYHYATGGGGLPLSQSKTFISTMLRCVGELQRADWGAAFGCAKPRYWGMTLDRQPVQSSQESTWWNDGT